MNIDPKVFDLVERFLGIAMRQVPNLVGAGSSISKLFKRTDEVTAEEIAAIHANLDAADKELGDAIAQRLGPDNH